MDNLSQDKLKELESKEKNITKVEEQTKLWQQQFTREVLTRLL